jgi:hypothetical protein
MQGSVPNLINEALGGSNPVTSMVTEMAFNKISDKYPFSNVVSTA